MQNVKQPIIHKAPVMGLSINVNKTGLCLNDTAYVRLIANGQIGVYAFARNRIFGVFRRKTPVFLGHLGPAATQIILPSLRNNDPLRVRIVGLNPEHLARGDGAEVHISVWGDLKHVCPPTPAYRDDLIVAT